MSNPDDPLFRIMERYRGYARAPQDPDGLPSIAWLRYLRHGDAPLEDEDEIVRADAPLVLVLVDPRLLGEMTGAASDLAARLRIFRADLRAAGWAAKLVEAKVYGSEPSHTGHRDGKTLLAIRDVFRDVRLAVPTFRGAILVGSFPEALLVHRIAWRHPAFDHEIIGQRSVAGRDIIGIEPGPAADRSEIVLADLTGAWDRLYVPSATIPSYKLEPDWRTAPPLADGATYVLPRDRWENVPRTIEDFFFIDDTTFSAEGEDALTVRIHAVRSDPEVSAEDRRLSNPTAQPDILVTRINARHVAVNPDLTRCDHEGGTFLDASGRPRTMYMPTDDPIDTGTHRFWHRDGEFERRLLVDYFDRNHAFRSGAFEDLPFRAAAFMGDEKAMKEFAGHPPLDAVRGASPRFEPPVYATERNSLVDYVDWLAKPAVARGLIAHSSPRGSEYGTSGEHALAVRIGGPPWRWQERTAGSHVYEPWLSSGESTRWADQSLMRTIWENRVLEGAGASFYVHGGCEVNSPLGARWYPYNATDPDAPHSTVTTPAFGRPEGPYGQFQNAEGILFFLNGLAVMSRAKVSNDMPPGFGPALRDGTFGDAWASTYRANAMDASLRSPGHVAACKRAYLWSVIGDWTLSVRRSEVRGATPPPVSGTPVVYSDPGRATVRHVFCGMDDHIHEVYRSGSAPFTVADLTALASAPRAARVGSQGFDATPGAYYLGDTCTPRVVYRGSDEHVHELWIDAGGVWRHADLSQLTGAAPAASNPFGYFTVRDMTSRVVYRGDDDHIHELWLDIGSSWQHADLSAIAGAPPAWGDPSACVTVGTRTARVIYRGQDDHIHVLSLGPDGRWKHADLSAATGAPGGGRDSRGRFNATPFVSCSPIDDTVRVVYRSGQDIHEIWLPPGSDSWHRANLSWVASAYPADGDPHAYSTAYDATLRVVYRGTDAHVHEMRLPRNGAWRHADLSSMAQSGDVAGDPRGSCAEFDGVARVAYRGTDGRLHQLALGRSQRWVHRALTLPS